LHVTDCTCAQHAPSHLKHEPEAHWCCGEHAVYGNCSTSGVWERSSAGLQALVEGAQRAAGAQARHGQLHEHQAGGVGVEAVRLVARPEQRRDGQLQRRQRRAQVGRRRRQAVPAPRVSQPLSCSSGSFSFPISHSHCLGQQRH
jgi:hypothetical protein